jgi:hypothetical protein
VSRRHFLFVIGARALPPKMAVGSKFASPSGALGTLRAAINDPDSKPIEITPDQWKFLRGVYAMNPEAPCGLPYGDDAVLAQDGGDPDGLLFFMDGDRPSAPVHAPSALLSLMERVAMADHGSGL